jgi:hypothetical protein
MSTSWSGPEASTDGYTSSEMTSIDKVVSLMVGQGWTLVGDAGDQGATGDCNNGLSIRYPSSSPNFVSAGGSVLQQGTSSATYEIAWTGQTAEGSCANNEGGSTGGYSNTYTTPGFQSGMGNSYRATPDLALDAWSSHAIYFNGGWVGFFGTSVVAPMLAGFFAQDDAYLLSIGNDCRLSSSSACAPLGNVNYPLYWQGHFPNGGHNPYYDITSGCNSNDITAEYKLTAYCAKAGFDEVTGWGSANMLQLAWAINWEVGTPNGIPYTAFSGPATDKWYNSSQTVSWTIVDYVGTDGGTGTGIAGFTQGWDSIPNDSYSEPSGINSGTGDSFYTGPQYPNQSKGCLSLVNGANGCSGGVSQGCHTAYVRGWNNIGWTTGASSYGPICYDSIAASTSISVGAPARNYSVQVTLSAVDPGASSGAGSGVSKVYYSVDNAACGATTQSSCTLYSTPFTISAAGSHIVRYFSTDAAGNVESLKSYSLTVR